jgi:hypothetical protein
MRNSYKILEGNLKGRNHMQDKESDEWIIIKWILKKRDMRVWTV